MSYELNNINDPFIINNTNNNNTNDINILNNNIYNIDDLYNYETNNNINPIDNNLRDSVIEFIFNSLTEEIVNENRNQNRNQVNEVNEVNNLENQTIDDTTENKLIPKCSICLQNNVSIICIPCNHVCSCHSCSISLDKCPICRTDIRQKSKIYLS